VRIDMLEGRLMKEEGESRLQEIRDALAFIDRIDAAGFLPREDIDKVQVIAAMKYVTPEGKEIPFLTPKERTCLSVQKGTLTDEMRKIMESHVEMTSRILDKVYFNSNYMNVPKWAGQHHEFLNGTGYPAHLTADDLDLETRILTVTDIYDALTSTDRPYKKPMPREKALDILRSMAEEGKVELRLVEWLGEALADKGTP
ncbi:MAG: HD domain-containing phosphohydrolase, partial [Acetatifactor sp.]|nr:HD domain-containing phosphohydrolase [Acetatifactor sp.]